MVTSGETTVTSTDTASTFTTTYTTPGIYDVTLHVTNTTTSQGTSASSAALFQIGARQIFVADGNAGTAYPYDTWATAATNIQTAINSAITGAEIIISNGTYLISSQLAVDKPMNIHSLTGDPRDVVVMRPPGSNTRILALNAGTDGLVHGLTLSDGFPGGANGGNVYIYNRGGTVSNCVIRNGYMRGKWEYGGGFAIDHGRRIDHPLRHHQQQHRQRRQTDGGYPRRAMRATWAAAVVSSIRSSPGTSTGAVISSIATRWF
jgi:hypothetical protein